MPYDNIESLPKYVKNYSLKIQRQWMHVFNTVYAKENSEIRAMKASNSVLKKRFTGKEQNWNKNDNDYVNHLLDIWLGNLKG